MSRTRRRVDDLLVAHGLADSRGQAARLVIAGEVTLGNRRASTPGELVPADTPVRTRVHERYVSRGGEKLEGALKAFRLSLADKRCVDFGASTGGFTDCLLQAGAERVTAVDVGYGQFDWKLRVDPRVTLLERTNVRSLDADTPGAPFDLAVCDLSFISLSKILPTAALLLKGGGLLVTLIKPQFEVPRQLVGAGGVVSDPQVHVQVVSRVLVQAMDAGLAPQGLATSPIRGREGNLEFLLLAQKDGTARGIAVEAAVARAHARFGI